jgi:hypothetical protein
MLLSFRILHAFTKGTFLISWVSIVFDTNLLTLAEKMLNIPPENCAYARKRRIASPMLIIDFRHCCRAYNGHVEAAFGDMLARLRTMGGAESLACDMQAVSCGFAGDVFLRRGGTTY